MALLAITSASPTFPMETRSSLALCLSSAVPLAPVQLLLWEKILFPAVPKGPRAQLLLLPKARSKFVCQGSEEEGWGRRGQWQNFEF